ncbi:FecR family protein [Thalassotalea sp. ND16A]|uniref:FecR family protein n=1 Tax=Thalassotalea sp. ND16A TaxID=1535422 RepID=UPI00051A6C17|nr:FecR domain-containing protein [Thalassotalea sp. ND16A]KGK00158.1 hypothetical protein ND16A_3629 [Thalassotalea sp. ND16A]
MKNNVIQLPNDDQILDQALHWLAEVDRGLTPEREASLKKWLGQSVKHKETFLEMASMWDNLDVLAQLSDVFPYKNSSKKWYNQTGFYKIAASVLFCLIASFYYVSPTGNKLVQQNSSTEYKELVATYRTKIGEHSTIKLPDNSIITLNTNSKVSVEYTHSQRNLVLEHGEVHIDVAHNKDRKFLVHAGDKTIEAIGTAFNVQNYNNVAIELLVTEGTVVVSELLDNPEPDKDSIIGKLSKFINDDKGSILAITAGEKINLNLNEKFKASKVTIEKINKEIETKLSWMEGKIVFKGESLQEAIEEISRYSPWKLELSGEKVKKVKIIGRFQTGDINLLLATLNKNFNIHSEHVDNSRIILSFQKDSS